MVNTIYHNKKISRKLHSVYKRFQDVFDIVEVPFIETDVEYKFNKPILNINLFQNTINTKIQNKLCN